jgi:hypothetical protein
MLILTTPYGWLVSGSIVDFFFIRPKSTPNVGPSRVPPI